MKNRLLWISFFSYMIIAFTLVVIGALLPEILTHYKQNYSNGGVLIFSQFIGFLLGVISMPFLVQKLGRKHVVVIGLFLISLELFIFFLPDWHLLFPLVALAGYGAGLAESCIGTIILVTFQEKQAMAMGKLEVAFGLGALFMPLFSSFLISNGIWEYAFFLLGISSFLVMLGWKLASFGTINGYLIKNKKDASPINQKISSYTKKTVPIIIFSAIYFFCYGGSEVSIVHFLPSIFREEWGISNSLATVTVTIYWLAMVIGRALTGSISEKFTYNSFLLFINIGGLLVLIAFGLNNNIWIGFFLCFLLGLCMAAMFAIALIITNKYFPGQTEKTTSILLAMNGFGGSVIPVMIGHSMDTYPVHISFWFFASIMFIMLMLIIGIQLLGTKQLSFIKELDQNHKG